MGALFWLRANPSEPSEPDDPLQAACEMLERTLGIEVAGIGGPQGGVPVKAVRAGSAADQVGIRAGDRIVACEYRSVWHAHQLVELISQIPRQAPFVTLLVESEGVYYPARFGPGMQPISGRPTGASGP